jgi:hypothetical protein
MLVSNDNQIAITVVTYRTMQLKEDEKTKSSKCLYFVINRQMFGFSRVKFSLFTDVYV